MSKNGLKKRSKIAKNVKNRNFGLINAPESSKTSKIAKKHEIYKKLSYSTPFWTKFIPKFKTPNCNPYSLGLKLHKNR